MSHFRQTFGRLSRGLNWYPKHMNSGLKQMQAKLRSVDCVLEVHDSRIPFSGRNPRFGDNLIRDKPHILILNKVDLITREASRRITDLLAQSGMKNVVFTNCKFDQDTGLKKVIPLIVKLIEESDRYHRQGTAEFHCMIIGVPNVGKSSFINILRSKNLKKGRALKVGPSAGVTKSVHEKVRISENPPIFLFDTPGILTPRIDGDETGLKLAVCGNLPDHDVGTVLIADYILFVLNKVGNWKYVKWLGLEAPSDCITTVLTKGCLHHNLMNTVRAIDDAKAWITKPNLDQMSQMFIEKFRTGDFGKFVLDSLEDADVPERFSRLNLSTNETFVSN